jgi:murein DD-endopeptidase MepM/ murein hydrolase activator NlpD
MLPSLKPLTQSVLSSLQAHPRRVMGALGALLLGTGITAFGIAPLAPDAARLPVHEVLDAVVLDQPLPDTPFAALDQSLRLYRSDVTRRDNTLNALLQRLGVNDGQATSYLRNLPAVRDALTGKPGKLVAVETDTRRQLQKLTIRGIAADEHSFKRVVIERHGAHFSDHSETAPLMARTRMASGTINSSLFAATDAAQIPDSIANQLAEIFSTDIDFRRDLRKGDRFTVVYESLEADGEPMRNGRVLSAEFVNNGHSLQSIWFQEPGSKGGYYGFDGQSKRRMYLAAPLEFSRVSSGYGMRFHPISGDQKPHLGVDYAAPVGTPVRAVGDGVVDFAGWQNGYGNFIVLNHRNGQSTAYGHLSRILVKKGQHVEQGNTIGAVGTTGFSTGPHLHFEFRDHGVHRDPELIAKQGEAVPVSPGARPAFNALAQRMKTELAAASQMQTASAD